MRADKLRPGGRGLTLWSWGEAMPLQNVAHGLGTDRVPEVGQGAHDPVVAPGAILPRHAHHQRLQFLVNRGTPWGLALLGAVKLLGHELTVPAKNRIGLDDLRDFLESLLAELLADARQGLTFAVTQPDAPLDLVAYDAILR